MSFEGYYQTLCVNHHLGPDFPVQYSSVAEQNFFSTYECDEHINGVRCGAQIDWTNLVDDTNIDSYGYRKLLLATEGENRTCDLGHTHVWRAPTYRPSTSRYYYDQESDSWVEISAEKTEENPEEESAEEEAQEDL